MSNENIFNEIEFDNITENDKNRLTEVLKEMNGLNQNRSNQYAHIVYPCLGKDILNLPPIFRTGRVIFVEVKERTTTYITVMINPVDYGVEYHYLDNEGIQQFIRKKDIYGGSTLVKDCMFRLEGTTLADETYQNVASAAGKALNIAGKVLTKTGRGAKIVFKKISDHNDKLF